VDLPGSLSTFAYLTANRGEEMKKLRIHIARKGWKNYSMPHRTRQPLRLGEKFMWWERPVTITGLGWEGRRFVVHVTP